MVPVGIDLLEGVSIVSITDGGRKQDWPASPDEGMLTQVRPGEVEIVGCGPSGACRTVFTAA